MLSVTVTITSDLFPAIIAKAPAVAEQIVRTAADHIHDHAQENARRDTGAMAAGVFVATHTESTYADAASAAAAAQPGVPLFGEPDQPEAGTAIVGAAVEYSIYLDQGTVHMAGDGWFTRAAEAERPVLQDIAAEAFKKLI